MTSAEAFIKQLTRWAEGQVALIAAGLVGSWARGTARPDSDVDVMLITATPGVYLDDWGWLTEFGGVRSASREDWGQVQSVRVYYEDGPEVEFGITTPAWTALDPVDPGTALVVGDGLRILFDPEGILAALRDAVRTGR